MHSSFSQQKGVNFKPPSFSSVYFRLLLQSNLACCHYQRSFKAFSAQNRVQMKKNKIEYNLIKYSLSIVSSSVVSGPSNSVSYITSQFDNDCQYKMTSANNVSVFRHSYFAL